MHMIYLLKKQEQYAEYLYTARVVRSTKHGLIGCLRLHNMIDLSASQASFTNGFH